MGRKLNLDGAHLKKAIVSILLALFYLVSAAASARECTCKDLAALRRRAQRAGMAEAAWKEIHGWARGLRRSPPLPASNKELNVRFAELMNHPKGSWESIMGQAVGTGEEPPQIGGLNPKGEPVIDENFQSQNCDDVIAAVRLHEEAHKGFFLAISLSRFSSELMPANLLWLRSESEVEAYRAEKDFLQGKADELQKKCKKSYQASGHSGELDFSGLVCDLEKPFTVSGSRINYKFQFSPSSPAAGTVKITAAAGPITEEGGGTYAIEGADTENPKIAVTGSVLGRAPVASRRTGGTFYIDLTPLETNECGDTQ